MHNSDFAFVQCCQSCFDQRLNDVYHLDYACTSELLLTNPMTAQCDDRRSVQWCQKFANRSFNWNMSQQTRLDCSNVPVAFRLCRKSCGYCASSGIPAQAIYNYSTAKDVHRCHNPSKGIIQRKQKFQKKSLFDNFHSRFTQTLRQKNRSSSEENMENIVATSETMNIKTTTRTTTHSPADYFLVVDHNYDNYDDDA